MGRRPMTVMRNRAIVTAMAAAILAATSGCRKTAAPAPMTLTVTSPDLQPGTEIPKQFTCDGAGISPALAWADPPAKTRSLAVMVTDPDAPMGTFTHWLLYNLPAAARSVPQGTAQKQVLPDGSQQGLNSGDEVGYYAPCPPGHTQHRYVFTVFALDGTITIPARPNATQVQKAMTGHILAAGQLMARYGR